MMKPFAYQQAAVDALKKVVGAGGRKGLVVMATGLGKTVTVGFFLQWWFSRRNGRILVLCHQEAILKQLQRAFHRFFGNRMSYGFFTGGRKDENVDFLFATFQTMRKHQRKFRRDEFSVVVVDESHRSHAKTFAPTVRYFSGAKFTLGVTATPERADEKDISDFFGPPVFELPLEEAVAQDLLAPVDYHLVINDDIPLPKASEGRSGSSLAVLNSSLFASRPLRAVARLIAEKLLEVENPRVMVFEQTVASCEEMRMELEKAIWSVFSAAKRPKFPAVTTWHSKMLDKVAEDRLERFRRGEIEVLITRDKANEGVDIPEVNFIVFNRSTASKTIFLQQLGRGMRKDPQDQGKVLRVLDVVGNYGRMKMIAELVEEVQRIRRERKLVTRSKRSRREPIIFDSGTVKLSTRAVDVLNLFRQRSRAGFSDEELIAQYRALSERLERPATREEVDADPDCAPWTTFHGRFRSLSKLRQLAGLGERKHRKRYDQETFIEIYRRLAKERSSGSRPLTREQIIRAGRELEWVPSLNVLLKPFGGSLLRLAQAAGYARKDINRPKSRKEILNEYLDLVEEMKSKELPTFRDIYNASRSGRCSQVKFFRKHFKDIAELQEAALKYIESTS